MAVAHLTIVDHRIRDAVTQQFEWDPFVDATAIGVTARDGVVTLTGFVDSVAGKLTAERLAKSVRGVRAVANDLDVRVLVERTDPELAADAVRAMDLRGTIPSTVQVTVHAGHITLTGRVNRVVQKMDAESAVRRIKGVRGVHNHITVAGQAVGDDVRHRITTALHRTADIDARHLFVNVEGSVATLKGTVTTWSQRGAAERAAAGAPGITQVDNEIIVEPPVELIDEQC